MSKYLNPDQSFIQGAKYRKGGGKGGGGGGGASVSQEIMDFANKGTFKPFSLSTSAGTGFGGADGQFGASSSDPFSQAQQAALGGANQLIPQISDHFGRDAAQFDFSGNDLAANRDRIFAEQSALLDPAFAQQRQQLKGDLFGSGRMGLSVAASGAGAGQEGFVNPDAFGLGRAQSQTLANVAAGAQQQALQQQQQQFGIESGQFGINEAMQQQRGQNLLTGAGGLFGLGSAVSEQELALLQAGMQGEALRGGSFLGAANALAAGQVEKKNDGGGKGLLGSAIGAAGNVGAAYVGSDERLKDNINKVGVLPNGLNLYTWTWNNVAKSLGINNPEVGVLAQEVLEVMPEAVKVGLDGYYRVNYSEVLNG